jgi:hypothetical protein
MPCSKLEARTGGKYVLVSPLGNRTYEGRIEECDPPRLIDFSGVTRFELFERDGGCRLKLILKRWPNGWNPVSLAGFHGWLDQLRLHLRWSFRLDSRLSRISSSSSDAACPSTGTP